MEVGKREGELALVSSETHGLGLDGHPTGFVPQFPHLWWEAGAVPGLSECKHRVLRIL